MVPTPVERTPLSDRNVETWKLVIDAFNERGIEGALEYFAEDIEVYDPDLPDGTRIRGHDAVRATIGEMLSGFDSFQVRNFEFHPVGDRVVGLFHTVGQGEGRLGDIEMEVRDAHTMTFRDGKVVYWRLYLDRKEALADAGLDPALAEVAGRGRR
jgi:ketosteroid isomerase-like protein